MASPVAQAVIHRLTMLVGRRAATETAHWGAPRITPGVDRVRMDPPPATVANGVAHPAWWWPILPITHLAAVIGWRSITAITSAALLEPLRRPRRRDTSRRLGYGRHYGSR